MHSIRPNNREQIDNTEKQSDTKQQQKKEQKQQQIIARATYRTTSFYIRIYVQANDTISSFIEFLWSHLANCYCCCVDGNGIGNDNDERQLCAPSIQKKKSIELQIFRNVAMSRGEYELQAAHKGRKGFRRVAKASEDSKGGKASEDLS